MYARVRRVKITTVGLSIALLTALSTGAKASFGPELSCTGSTETLVITMPASITVPRDAAIGTVLTSWVSSSANVNLYQCEGKLGSQGETPSSGINIRPVNLISTNLKVASPGGDSYTVWSTNLPGIGLAIGIRFFMGTCGWQPFMDVGSVINRRLGGVEWAGFACNSTHYPVTNGGQVQMALVKTGPVQAGTVTPGIRLEGASATRIAASGHYDIALNGRKLFLVSSTTINVAACNTADVAVDLGFHKQSRFTGVGSTTPAVAFNVGLSACPAGLNAIQYQFIPPTAVLDSSNGVLALSADSTAAGIGVQLKDGNGSPLKYNTPYTLTHYNKTTGGTYNIPLRASYYQTSGTVKPGTAKSLLTFTMSYQ